MTTVYTFDHGNMTNLECEDCKKQIDFTEAYTVCEKDRQIEPLCNKCFFKRMEKKQI